MPKKSRIFSITTEFPWPPTSGGRIKTFQLVKFLSQHFDVDFLSAYGADGISVEALRKQTSVLTVRAFQYFRNRTALDWLKALLRFPTLSAYRVYSSEVRFITQVLCRKADLVFVDHLAMMQMIPERSLSKVIYHSHNAEFHLWEGLARLEPNPVKKILILLEAGRVKRFEKKIICNVRFTFASPNDQQVLMQATGLDRERFRDTYHLGNEFFMRLPLPDLLKNERRIFYAGTLSWLPNSDGLKWFLTQCWKRVRKEVNDASMVICGAGADRELQNLIGKSPGVRYKGFVDDLDAEMRSCRVAIVPLRFGSGMKIKTFDALYRGLPLVTTSIGAEGIDIDHDKHALIADSPRQFALSVSQLLLDCSRGAVLAAAGRKLAAQRYLYDPILEEMLASMSASVVSNSVVGK